MFLSNQKMIVRMGFGFGVLLIFLFLALVLGLGNMGAVQERLDRAVNESAVKENLAGEMRFYARHEAVIVRNILLLEDASMKADELRRFQEGRKKYDAAEERFIKLVTDEKGKAILARALEGKKAVLPIWDGVIKMGMENRRAQGALTLVKEARAVQWKWLDGLDELAAAEKETADNYYRDSLARYSATKYKMSILGLAALISGVLLAVFITLGVTVPLSNFIADVDKIAAGDLTVRTSCGMGGELGELGSHINRMAAALHDTIKRVSASANNVLVSVETLIEVSEKTARGVFQGVLNASTAASAIDGITASTAKASATAQSASGVLKNASARIVSAKDAIEDAVEAIESSGLRINALHEGLNVADLNVSDAAKKESSENLRAAEDSTLSALKIAKTAGAALDEVGSAMDTSGGLIAQLAASIAGGSAASMEILQAVDKISQTSKDMERMSDELIKEIRALISVSEDLRNTIGVFKT
jgi:methyl-accepting chemotaxis protein